MGGIKQGHRVNWRYLTFYHIIRRCTVSLLNVDANESVDFQPVKEEKYKKKKRINYISPYNPTTQQHRCQIRLIHRTVPVRSFSHKHYTERASHL